MKIKGIRKLLCLAFVFCILLTAIRTSINANIDTAGKISPYLSDILDESDSNEKIPVFIWLEEIDLTEAFNNAYRSIGMYEEQFIETVNSHAEITYTDADIDKYINNKRNNVKDIYENRNTSLAYEFLNANEILYISKYTPCILAEIPKEKVYKLINYSYIKSIDYYNATIEPQITNSRQVVRVPQAVTGYNLNGSGIKIGVYDYGNIDTSNAAFSGISITRRYTTAQVVTNEHPNRVTAIITNIAPNATYFYTTSLTVNTSYVSEFEWLIQQGVNVINVSLAFGTTYSVYDDVSKYIDALCYNSDVSIITAAGNFGSSGISGGCMGYNSIAVGNYDYNGTITNYTDDTIKNDSSYYSGSALAFKPDICAPGTGIASAGYTATNGTSLSAPHVTGIAALLMQKDSTLKIFTCSPTAILTASVNMTTPHHYVPANRSSSGNNYMKFGSGLVDAYAAANLINNNQFYTGYLSTSQTVNTHNLVVNSTDIGKTFRISLVIQKHSSESYSLSDLDLEIKAPAGTTMKISSTTNNIEICEFTPAVSGTYTINVKKISAPPVNSYFSVAWSKS